MYPVRFGDALSGCFDAIENMRKDSVAAAESPRVVSTVSFSESKASKGWNPHHVGNAEGSRFCEVDEPKLGRFATELPDYRGTGSDTHMDADEGLDPTAGYRGNDKGSFESIIYREELRQKDEVGGHCAGNPVIRQSGDSALCLFEVLESTVVADPIELLPPVLSKYATNLCRDRNISPMSAAAAVMAGASSALGKGVYATTFGEHVHPNLHILNIAPSGTGKKAFHAPMERTTKVLGEIEAASRKNREKFAKELRTAEKALEEAKTRGNESEVLGLEGKLDKLRNLSRVRNLAFGEDVSPQVIARSLVEPGQGAACVVNSGEGSMFFSKFAGCSKRDGYGTLLTKSFNDTEYVLSRVDEGRNTHGRASHPRLFLTISTQNSTIPETVSMIPPALGVFQRFLYVVEEGRSGASSPPKLFIGDGGIDPFELAYIGFVRTAVNTCWASDVAGTHLTFSQEAKELLQAHCDDCHKLAEETAETDPIWSEYVRRQTEQVIKLVQTFHVAACANASTGEIDWAKVKKPISGSVLERSIAFHRIWTEHTRRFVDLWIKPVKKGDEGLTVEKVKGAMFKAMGKSNEPESGVQSADVLKYLPKGTTSEEFKRITESNPREFKVTISGDRGKKLYIPIVDATSFRVLVEEGGRHAA